MALFIFGFFLRFCLPALRVRFALDEMMNMYWYWSAGIWKVGWAGLTFSNSVIRPMGALYYVPLFKIFGFNPLPFNVFRLAVLALNLVFFFHLAARITGVRLAAAAATVVVAYHAQLSNLAYVGSFIYDAFCGGFYFSALLYYIRCRDLYGRLNLFRSCVFLGLYVCALNSKEMAVSLPVLVFAYELLFQIPDTWRKSRPVLRSIFTDAAPFLASVAITIVFIGIKTWGAGSLISAEAFRPAYTWNRFFETNVRYLNEIFYTKAFTPGLVILAWAALLYAGLRTWDRRLLLLCVWVVVTPLPIAFISGRGGACLYIVAAGWSMVAAIACEALARRIAAEPVFARLPPQAVVVCLMLAGALLYGRETLWYHGFFERAYLNDGQKTANLIRQFQRLPVRPRPHSSIVFLRDPFPGFDDTLYIASLWWNDHSLRIRLQNKEHMPEDEVSRMDYVFDFRDGQLTQRKR